jgi:mannose-6-phosphate isomerase-like protein (cupin superfamily)
MSETGTDTQYVRTADFATFPAEEVHTVGLAGVDSGVASSTIGAFRVPAGMAYRGGPMHTHPHVDQFFYVLSGTLSLEINGVMCKAGPGSVAYIPAGAPHRNWNEGPEACCYIEFVPGQLGAGPPQPSA